MNVLFICNGNVARSQEAEAFYNNLSQNPDNHSASAGINVKIGKPIDPNVVEVMSEEGYDLSTAQRKLVSEPMVQDADLIVSFKPKGELPDFVVDHSNIEYWDVADPQHQSIEFHRLTRNTVKNLVEGLIKDR